MPGPLGILVPWLLSLMVCVLLAGRKLSLVRLTLSVAASQFLFHYLFVLGTITPSGVTGGHVHGAPLELPSGVSSVPLSAEGVMWAGHVIAALFTIAALHRGERMLLGLSDLATRAARWVRQRMDAPLTAVALESTVMGAPLDAESRRSAEPFLATRQGRAPPAAAVGLIPTR